jgi:UDP-glucose 4-epimerase
MVSTSFPETRQDWPGRFIANMAEALARREEVLREGFGAIRTMLEHARQGTAMEFWGDGETVRDFLFIEDWVEACWRLLAPQAPVGVYNVGVGEGCSLNTLRAVVERVTGRELRVRWQPARSVDVRGVVLDSTRLRAATGWAPQLTLEEGIQRMWTWLEAGGGMVEPGARWASSIMGK